MGEETSNMEGMPDWGEAETPMDDVTISEVDALCRDILKKRSALEAMEDTVKGLRRDAEHWEKKLLAYLTHFGKKSYPIDGSQIQIRGRTSFKIPQSDEKKTIFFEFLKARGIFERYATVHSAALNSFCNAELEVAQAEGRTEFEIPGIESPTYSESIVIRKAK